VLDKHWTEYCADKGVSTLVEHKTILTTKGRSKTPVLWSRREKTMKQTIKAVHDDDLDEFLERLEIASKFEAGNLKCAFCGEIVTKDNLHSIFPDSGAIKFSCCSPECVMKLMTRLEKKSYG
jgi:hypothetical protein